MDNLIASLLAHKEDIRAAFDLVMAHKVVAALAFFFASGMGANILARLINRIPLGWWYGIVWGVFRGLSLAGNHRLGRPLWKPFEEFIKRVILKTAEVANDGLASDDADGQGAGGIPQGINPTPPPTPLHGGPAIPQEKVL